MTMQPDSTGTVSAAQRASWGRFLLSLGVVAVALVGIGAYLLARDEPQPLERAAAPVGDLVPGHQPGVLFRNADGLVVTVPKGLALQRHPFELTPTIEMTVGQRIEVRNEDQIAHIVFGMVVPAGGSRTMVLERAGILVYSAGCAAHVSGSGLTTLLVSEPESES